MGLYVVLMYENSVIILAQIAISICQFAETVQMPVCKLTVRPTKQHNLQLEKCLWWRAMYCNLRLPNAARVVLDFN